MSDASSVSLYHCLGCTARADMPEQANARVPTYNAAVGSVVASVLLLVPQTLAA